MSCAIAMESDIVMVDLKNRIWQLPEKLDIGIIEHAAPSPTMLRLYYRWLPAGHLQLSSELGR